jgi:hypothetical protein
MGLPPNVPKEVLRDRIATAAMHALIQRQTGGAISPATRLTIVDNAYLFADAMMLRRKT